MRWLLVLIAALCAAPSAIADPFTIPTPFFLTVKPPAASSTTSNILLIDTGSALLIDTGNKMLIQ